MGRAWERGYPGKQEWEAFATIVSTTQSARDNDDANIDFSSQHDVQQPGVETLRENVIEKMENFCGYQQWC